MTNKAVILARVSTLRQEQEGLSLKEIQLPLLREYAEAKGIEIAQEFVFSESADSKIRTKFNEMIDFVKKNKDIQTIIAYRVDRMTRNFRDAVLIDELMKEHGKEIHFVYDHLVINKTSVGRVLIDWDTKVYLAKQFLNRLKEDAVNSAHHMIKAGLFPGKGPYGYKNVKVDKKKSWIEPDPVTANIVRDMYQWYATGSISMGSIVKKLKDEFALKMSKCNVERILKNRFYIGYAYRKDSGEYKHCYESIISNDLFETVQKTIDGHRKKKSKFAGISFAYRGLIKCAHCGLSVTPERHKNGKYIYYHCTEYNGKHGAKWVSEEDITKQLSGIFKSMEIPPVVLADLKKSLLESHEDKKHFYSDLKKQYETEYSSILKRMDRMYDDRLKDIITEAQYLRRVHDYQIRLDELNDKLTNLHKASNEYYINAIRVLELASRASSLFESSEVEQKRLLVSLALSNLRLEDDKLVYDWIRPFDVIVAHASCNKWRAL